MVSRRVYMPFTLPVATLIRLRLFALLTVLALGLTLPSAVMATGKQVLSDLNDNGLIDHCYTLPEFDAALKLLSVDDGQYDNKADTIRQGKLDHLKAPGLACPNPTTSTPVSGSGTDSSVPGYVLWGIVGGAIGLAAVVGGVLARKSRGDEPDEHADE